MKFGTMVLCVVADRDHAATSYGTCFAELLQKLQKGFAVETPGFAPKQKPAIPQTHRREVTHALACRVVIHDRVAVFRRNPQAAAGTLLLKVPFVSAHRSTVSSRISLRSFF